MASYTTTVEVDVTIEELEGGDQLKCSVPNGNNSGLDLQACENAIQDQYEFEVYSYHITLGNFHYFNKE